MFCSRCGANVAEGAAFCASCGQPVGGVPPAPGAGMPQAGYAAAPAGANAAARPTVAYAGFWLRVVAAIIDGILIGIPMVPFYIAIFASMLPELRPTQNPFELLPIILPRLFILMVIMLVASWLYWGLMESSAWQATLGKKALGLKVTDLEGRRATFGRTSGRFFAGRGAGMFPYVGGLYFLISCICAGFTEKKQAIHDMIASCLVIRMV